MLKKLFIVMAFVYTSIDVAYSNNLFLRSSLSVSHSDSLWLMGDKKSPYQGTNLGGNSEQADRVYYQASLDGTLSLDEDFDLYLGFRYGYVKQTDAPFLGALENDSRNQISEMSIGGGYSFYKSSSSTIGVFLKYLHPGETKRSKPAFLSFNDFSSYLEPGFYGSFYFKTWEYHPLIKYKHKLAGLGNHHAAMENKFFYNFTKRFKVGPGVDFLTTSGGRDIADPAFMAYHEESTWFPTWNKKEKWLGLSLMGAYLFKNQWVFDFLLHRKLIGENTDISTTFAIGIGKGFDL